MPSTCKAWVLSGPRSMRFQDVPVPDHLEDGQALGRIEASGICGTDWEQYVGQLDETGILEYPCIIGHEPLLRVERLTPAARRKWNLEEGDPVLAYALGCNVCRYCLRGQHVLCDSPELIRRGFTSAERGLWGSLAEYMLISDSVIYKIPESVSAEDALLYNPLSAGFEWAVERGGVGMGDDVLILGAGQRGLASVVACVEARASRIIVSGLPPTRKNSSSRGAWVRPTR